MTDPDPAIGTIARLAVWTVAHPERPADQTGIAAVHASVVTDTGATTAPMVELAVPASAVDPDTGIIRWDADVAVNVARRIEHAARTAHHIEHGTDR